MLEKEGIDEARERYVEDFGLLLGQYGMARMLGRVLAALLISDPPECTAEELAWTLRASRGSISSATRSLVQMGLVERMTKPGERRDYFMVRRGSWMELTRRQMAAATALRGMAERGLELLGSRDREVRRGLEEMRSFYAFWESELPAALARWEMRTKGGR